MNTPTDDPNVSTKPSDVSAKPSKVSVEKSKAKNPPQATRKTAKQAPVGVDLDGAKSRKNTVSLDPYMHQIDALGIEPLDLFDNTRIELQPRMRLEVVRQKALAFREQMLATGKVAYYKSVDLIRVPYPTKYGLFGATTVPTPFMHILNRLFVVQFKSKEGLKTLLFSPSDIEANRETPFFKNLSERSGPIAPYLDKFLAPRISTVEEALNTIGIKPEQVDYISYDHLHTQDVRRWLGSGDEPGIFPNAKLLVMKQEWISTQGLLPSQAYWYCPNGIAGISSNKVVLLESSVVLGEGVALIQTPGHTEGNHSLVAHTDAGLLVTSENGVSADNYAPLQSDIPGVRKYAQESGSEVILNGNTQESSVDQYISMVMEKTIAGPNKDNPAFFNFVPSSELTPYWGFPGIKPTFSYGELEFGEVKR